MTKKIFIFEHIIGGGMVDQEPPQELVTQGFAMLRASIEDFIAAGHRVSTTLDHRADLSSDGLEVLIVKQKRSAQDRPVGRKQRGQRGHGAYHHMPALKPLGRRGRPGRGLMSPRACFGGGRRLSLRPSFCVLHSENPPDIAGLPRAG